MTLRNLPALLLAVSVMGLAPAASAAAPSGIPFDECGDMVQGVTCPIMFEDTMGRLWILDDTAGFQVGDHVRVIGTSELGCISLCNQGNGCIHNNTVSVCGAVNGTNYCISAANSVGAGASMSATGSDSVGANNLVLLAGPVPDQPGIFFYGPDQVQTPFGNGFQCVGGNLSRLDVELGAGGVLSHSLNNTLPPTMAGLITPGSTWHFQAWYRDPAAGGANFNLSDGYSILFTN
jgi:hypothetical protein